jgi:hypothetical protein
MWGPGDEGEDEGEGVEGEEEEEEMQAIKKAAVPDADAGNAGESEDRLQLRVGRVLRARTYSCILILTDCGAELELQISGACINNWQCGAADTARC